MESLPVYVLLSFVGCSKIGALAFRALSCYRITQNAFSIHARTCKVANLSWYVSYFLCLEDMFRSDERREHTCPALVHRYVLQTNSTAQTSSCYDVTYLWDQC